MNHGRYRTTRPGTQSDELGEARVELLSHRPAITKWLAGEDPRAPALRLTKVHELLRRQDVHVSYATLRRFAVEHCGFDGRQRRLTIRFDKVSPGEVAHAAR